MRSIKLVAITIVSLVLLIVSALSFKVVTINGNERGVVQDSAGIKKDTLPPGTHFFMWAFFTHITKYDMTVHAFAMNNKSGKAGEVAEGRARDAYRIASSDSQALTFQMNLRWRRDPTKLVTFHTEVGENPEEKIIRSTLMRVVKDEATVKKALEQYSGQGLVDLQAAIEKKLLDPNGELALKGIIVENFVLEDIDLDPEYETEIKQKQIAVQKQLRNIEEQKAAEGAALVAKSVAQADYNTKTVQAERDKLVQVTKAQADNEQAIIAAKAEQQKRILEAEGAAQAAIAQAEASKQTQVLEAEGKKVAMLAIAEGTLAQGKAVAESQRLLLEAWSASGASSFAKVEVAKTMGTAFSNIKGFYPQDLKINVLANSYLQAIDAATGNPVIPVK